MTLDRTARQRLPTPADHGHRRNAYLNATPLRLLLPAVSFAEIRKETNPMSYIKVGAGKLATHRDLL
jgi:hypothetical protein